MATQVSLSVLSLCVVCLMAEVAWSNARTSASQDDELRVELTQINYNIGTNREYSNEKDNLPRIRREAGGDFRRLEQLRIAKLRSQRRREEKSQDVLIGPVLPPRQTRQRGEPKKSKRIGKVVIKLRNGKKLVVKKKRKPSNGSKPSKTTQRPVLVTTKAVSQVPTRLNIPSGVSLPPLSPPSPAPVFQTPSSIPIDNELLKVINTDQIKTKKTFQSLPSGSRPASRPTSSFPTTPRPPQLPAIIVTPHSEPGIRSKARLFENDIKVAEEEEKDFYDEYYDYYNDITEQEQEENRATQITDGFRTSPQVSTFPPPEERFAAIDQADFGQFSNFPRNQAQPNDNMNTVTPTEPSVRTSQPRQSLSELRQGLSSSHLSTEGQNNPSINLRSRPANPIPFKVNSFQRSQPESDFNPAHNDLSILDGRINEFVHENDQNADKRQNLNGFNVQVAVPLPNFSLPAPKVEVQQDRQRTTKFEEVNEAFSPIRELKRFNNPAIVNNFDNDQSILVPNQHETVNNIGAPQEQPRRNNGFPAQSFNQNDFTFTSLPSRFSALKPNDEEFFFGPPKQIINMRDGSYTIITVLN